jgi:hypothetical protein
MSPRVLTGDGVRPHVDAVDEPQQGGAEQEGEAEAHDRVLDAALDPSLADADDVREGEVHPERQGHQARE